MTPSEYDNEENSEEDLDEEQSREDIDPDNVFPAYEDTADVPGPTNFQAAIEKLEATAFRRRR